MSSSAPDRSLVEAQLQRALYFIGEALREERERAEPAPDPRHVQTAIELALEYALIGVVREERARAGEDRLRCLRDGYASGLEAARRELGLVRNRVVPPPPPPAAMRPSEERDTVPGLPHGVRNATAPKVRG